MHKLAHRVQNNHGEWLTITVTAQVVVRPRCDRYICSTKQVYVLIIISITDFK